ncbi:phospholipase A2 inhibitor beta [Schistocerca gregaria]|uniref:phospholipase A2 inhibitor beta n=1 Tax=Schistocerca gregaria TaxID=7010 RepID=UPI00211DE92C|nr:phospholipase A2 inhibitor beta [Schistocerca gregaria]
MECKLLLLVAATVLFTAAVVAEVEKCGDEPGKSTIENCGPTFHNKCFCGTTCYLNKWYYVVNCTNTGFTDTSVLANLPPEIEVLVFNGNKIRELPWNVFGRLNNYTKLQVVDMSNNGLQVIRGKSYHRVSNVQLLILNHNELNISSDGTGKENYHHPRIFSNFEHLMELHLTDAFADNTPEGLAEDLHDIFVKSNLTHLIKLHLEQNEIHRFKDPKVFCDLPALMDLHLGDNKLKDLDFNIECLPNLRFIDLEKNDISVLDSKQLDKLDILPARNQSLLVDLGGNPFTCDCRITDFYKWLQNTHVTVRNKGSLQCHSGLPESNAGQIVSSLRQIQCPPEETASSQHHVIPILVSFLVCLILIFCGVVLYMNWFMIKSHVTPILDSISRKVQYTSIGKQEEQEMDV